MGIDKIEHTFYNKLYTEGMGVYGMDWRRAAPVDVICAYFRDGTVEPLRIRVKGDDGINQAYKIYSFRDVSHQGTRQVPNGAYVSDRALVFECIIIVFGVKKRVVLYYEPANPIWKITA